VPLWQIYLGCDQLMQGPEKAGEEASNTIVNLAAACPDLRSGSQRFSSENLRSWDHLSGNCVRCSPAVGLSWPWGAWTKRRNCHFLQPMIGGKE
jgi:hypothetical protein